MGGATPAGCVSMTGLTNLGVGAYVSWDCASITAAALACRDMRIRRPCGSGVCTVGNTLDDERSQICACSQTHATAHCAVSQITPPRTTRAWLRMPEGRPEARHQPGPNSRNNTTRAIVAFGQYSHETNKHFVFRVLLDGALYCGWYEAPRLDAVHQG